MTSLIESTNLEEEVKRLSSEVYHLTHTKEEREQALMQLIESQKQEAYNQGVVDYAKAHKETLDEMDKSS